MRTKKRIREDKKNRIVLGFSLMILSLVMIVSGYLAHEYDMFIVQVLRENFTSKSILTIVTIVWFSVSIILFAAGLLVIILRAVRHHDYVERPHSSRV